MPARSSHRAYAPRSLRVVGPIVGALFLIPVFMYLRFPYDRLAETLEIRIERATGTRVQMAALGPGLQLLGPGLAADDVRVTRPDGATFSLEQVKLRPAWSLSWLTGRPAVHLVVRSSFGEARGTLTLGSDPGWSGRLFDVDLGRLPAAALAPGISLTGRAEADLEIVLAADGPVGSAQIVAREGSVEHPDLFMALPFETLECALRLGGEQRAEIVSLDLESQLVTASLKGVIGRSPGFSTAPLRIEGSFTVSPEIRGVLGARGARLGSGGSGQFVVTGTPARPVVR
ncbi:MAG TPA: type II secretion system protein GspN [Myxococcota bacterium]